ncbi:MAG TPA: translocation/assembly module TamB domain-containing protein [Steroidobacteraceae bacterium]|nr:translocation/assembly module TamB domain-containing protein [Steroidobacteraceae bacterium]
MSRAKRIAAWTGGTLAALLVAVGAWLGWLLFTTPGARWIAATATQRFAPQVKYASIDGTIAGVLEVRDFRFEGGADTAKIRIARLAVDPTLSMLLSRTLRIERATVSGLSFTLPEKPKPDEPDQPLWIEPPVEVVVRDFALEDGRIFDHRKQIAQVRQLGVSARWTRESLDIERLTLLPGDIDGSLEARGRITPHDRTVRAVLHARWKDVVIPEKLAGRTLATAGEIDLDGTPQRYTARGALDFGPPGQLAHIVLSMHGTDRAATLDNLDLTQRAGKLNLHGDVQFDPRVAWNLFVRADDFDPGAFLAQWPGRLDLDFSTRGTLEDAGPRGALRIATLSGVLRGRPLAGTGELQFAAPSTLDGVLRVSSGRSRVEVRGAAGKSIDATVDLAVASLNDWLPDAQGSLSGRFRVRGAWPKLSIDGGADGRALALATPAKQGEPVPEPTRVGNVHVDARVDSPLDPAGSIAIAARGLHVAGLRFATVQVNGSGNQARHRVRLEADGERFDGSVELAGGLTAGGWSGELQKLVVDAPDVARLALRAPAHVLYDDGAFSLGQSCFVDQDSSLCVAASLARDGAIDGSYSFDRVPLGLANALAPRAMPGDLRGEVRGAGKLRRTAAGEWFGEARVTSPEARLVMRDTQPGESALGQQTFTLYENLDARAGLEGTRGRVRLHAELEHGGRIDGSASLSALDSDSPGVRGELAASVPTLAPFGGFVPTMANIDGGIDARVQFGGTLAAPEVTGNVRATRLQADLGDLGIELREGEAQAEALRGGGLRLSGQVRSGKGRIGLRGTMSGRGVVDLQIDGRDFVAADIPAAQVVIAPKLALTGDPKAWLLAGEVAIARADVNLQKLPRDQPPGASPDVIVVRNGRVVESAAQQASLPLTADINVILGDKIKIVGYGLDAAVTGQLRVREAPGAAATGSGQLSVSGRYKAYGQDLTIQQGRLLFAGTPLDNPRLSIVAMREINDVLSTGLRIAGSAQKPVITVISDPEVGEADALSYLVTGHSLSEVGTASGSSQDALASATRSLESAGAGLVAKRIGKRLGLDEASVEENEMIGGSALTIGEYLSPRLYLSYGVGLFQPGEVIALRYKLSKEFGVKVERGTEETRTGVEYRIER